MLKKAISLLAEKCDVNFGGYLTVNDGFGFLFGCRVGIVLPKEVEMLLAYSAEKAKRLFANPLDNTSFQSSDPDKLMFGGAIRASGFILSFAGTSNGKISELDDEAVVTCIAYRANWIRLNEGLEIGVASRNNHLIMILSG